MSPTQHSNVCHRTAMADKQVLEHSVGSRLDHENRLLYRVPRDCELCLSTVDVQHSHCPFRFFNPIRLRVTSFVASKGPSLVGGRRLNVDGHSSCRNFYRRSPFLIPRFLARASLGHTLRTFTYFSIRSPIAIITFTSFGSKKCRR